ncbi:hypothetical protein AAG906_026224 [Vitis piasezkii]
MASIQEAITSLGQRMDGHVQYDPTIPPPLPPIPQPTPFTLQSQIEVAPPPAMVVVPTSEDTHARMDRLEQRMRQMRVSDGGMVWDDFDGLPVANLPAKFRMPEIERYMGIGCPRIHLRLYSIMIMLFPMSLSRVAQCRSSMRQSHHSSPVGGKKIPRFARHLMGFPHVDFGSLVQALYDIEEGIARGMWPYSSPLDSKGKKSVIGQRSGYVNAISATRLRPPRYYQTVVQTFGVYYPPSPHVQYRSPVPFRPMSPTYLHSTQQPPRAPPTQKQMRQFSQLGMPLSRAFQKLLEGGLLTALALRSPPQPLSPQFKMDLHCAFHQVNLGQPNVTMNPLPAHTIHSVPPPTGGIHHMDFVQDDVIHMLNWADGLPEMIVPDDGYEIVGATSYFSIPAPFNLIPDKAPLQLIHFTPSYVGHRDIFAPFILWPEDVDVQVMTRITKPFGGTDSREEVRREDGEILR